MKPLIHLILLIFVMQPLHVWSAETKPDTDVRVVVDISGSMKKNDPENLRIPAVQLFSQLLPPDSQSGIWTFGQYVNMLVPLAEVDKAWKAEAVRLSSEISSAGLYTNIGGAIERATFGWNTPEPGSKRSLILLTDGMVDVSKDPAVNQTARDKLLNETLPRLREAGVVIHTIALAGDADQELLKQLSEKTDGWYQKVHFASELQKVFLKIFGQATERDSVPLENNRFFIDDQITEYTLLVFKKSDTNPTQLISPSGKTLSADEDSPEVSWFETEGYDVITVSQPEVGKWEVLAEIDPNNQVLVVSNIQIKSSAIPNNLLAGEKVNLEMYLNQDQQLITDRKFLDLINMQLETTSKDDDQQIALLDDGNMPDSAEADGIYSATFSASTSEGMMEITTLVESPTFQRLRQQAINIFASPLLISHQTSESIDGYHTLQITPIAAIIKPEMAVIRASVTMPDGVTVPLSLQTADGFVHNGSVDVFEQGGTYQINIDVDGFTQNDRVFRINSLGYSFDTPALGIDVPEPVVEQPLVVETTEPESTSEMADIDWYYWFLIAGILNVGVLILWFLVSLITKKRTAALANALAGRLETTDE